MMTKQFPYLILLGFTFIWCTGIFIAPFVKSETSASVVYAAYNQVCHQLADHSFHIHGSILAVCVRCTAIYTAFFTGIILYPLLRRYNFSFISYRYYIVFLAVPMVVDVAASWLTGYSSTIVSRVITGGLFGFGAALLLTPLFVEAIFQLVKSKSIVSHSNNHGGYV